MDDNQHMHARTDSPVSLELLEEYTGGDPEFLAELTAQFWSDMEQRLPELRTSVSSFEGAALKKVAHTIAGAAICVGAEGLRRRALALQECGQDPTRADQAPVLLRDFESELIRVRNFFTEYLA